MEKMKRYTHKVKCDDPNCRCHLKPTSGHLVFKPVKANAKQGFKRDNDGVSAVLSTVLMVGLVMAILMPTAYWGITRLANATDNFFTGMIEKLNEFAHQFENLNTTQPPGKPPEYPPGGAVPPTIDDDNETFTVGFVATNTTGFPYVVYVTFHTKNNQLLSVNATTKPPLNQPPP